jgi:hypothetical protein
MFWSFWAAKRLDPLVFGYEAWVCWTQAVDIPQEKRVFTNIFSEERKLAPFRAAILLLADAGAPIA